ncbi:putative selenate ABC transporter substrate-binding protein [Spiribacter sp. 1M153]|uniref:Selenate ABC transporter substrate-binding protein n=1 Tax=Spiribacter roseus TaxID=1855875 RepID=A0ABV3RYV1_9GAMM|nr:putative selenate ABC transporter substrate-binding protein [Spiribacter sp. SSL99]KAF0285094.1 putative selenate ABC transporter substrate-binding protein [Spiribacter sp. SSL99]
MRFIHSIALLALFAVAPAQAQVFTFTAIPDQDESRLEARFNAVGEYLEEQLDVDVRYVPVKSYAAAVSAFRNNQVQLAWFGGLSGVQARARVPGSRALARGEEDQGFRSYFIAHESTGLMPADTLEEALRGRTFTFGSKSSTSGRLMPEFHLRDQFGEAPDEVFERVGYSGNHSRTLRLVESGSYQVGALNYAVWERELAAGNINTDAVQVIWETPGYLNYQWSIRGDVDERFGDGFVEKVRTALLSMDDPDLLERFPRSGFVPVSNDDYAGLEQTARAIGLID